MADIRPTGWTLKGRWWNGSYGRINRRDIWLYTNGHVWRVDARQGDGDAKIWSKTMVREEDARELAADMRARTGDTWRELTSVLRQEEERIRRQT